MSIFKASPVFFLAHFNYNFQKYQRAVFPGTYKEGIGFVGKALPEAVTLLQCFLELLELMLLYAKLGILQTIYMKSNIKEFSNNKNVNRAANSLKCHAAEYLKV